MTGKQRDRKRPASYQTSYEIRVRGHLGATMLRAFPALRAETQGQDTLLRGAVADQAALHGVLAQIEALGLELLEVRRLPDESQRRSTPPVGSARERFALDGHPKPLD
jgi:hypothetical protein